MNDQEAIGQKKRFSLDFLTPLMELQFQVEQFYYYEAAALDERRFSDWLELFTDDTRYWMPIRRTRTATEAAKEFTQPGDVAYFDDSKAILQSRVKKLQSRTAWSENPPSRTRHLITNVRILEHPNGSGSLTASSNFHLYRTRFDSEEDNWVGWREDVLLRTEDSFRIQSRKIFLDQTVILAQNLSSLF